MKASVIKEMTTEELQDKLVEEKELYSKLKLNHAVSPLENPLSIRSKRKVIARLRTELNKRAING
ncbi:MAG: 50S ribosomal protein L29 [Flavobacteriales bacterium]|nr:50S ribosomal protein L29 [Flavobacteriales bacterium]